MPGSQDAAELRPCWRTALPALWAPGAGQRLCSGNPARQSYRKYSAGTRGRPHTRGGVPALGHQSLHRRCKQSRGASPPSRRPPVLRRSGARLERTRTNNSDGRDERGGWVGGLGERSRQRGPPIQVACPVTLSWILLVRPVQAGRLFLLGNKYPSSPQYHSLRKAAVVHERDGVSLANIADQNLKRKVQLVVESTGIDSQSREITVFVCDCSQKRQLIFACSP